MTALMLHPSHHVAAPAPAHGARSVFARFDVSLPAWFALADSARVRGDRPLLVDAGPRRIALWRDSHGAVHASSARCAHLGASFSLGRVVGDALQCGLHHWRFGGDGRCTSSPGTEGLSSRCVRAFPVVERFGQVFVWTGERAPVIEAPALPDGDDARDFFMLRLRGTRLGCHHHLTTANGLDALHFGSLHDVELKDEPRLVVDAARRAVHLHLRPRHRRAARRAITGDWGDMRFSAFGPSIAWATNLAPVRAHALFATRPDGERGSFAQATLFLPKRGLVRALRPMLFLLSLLYEDGLMLDSLAGFEPAFAESDAPLRAFAEILDAWPRT